MQNPAARQVVYLDMDGCLVDFESGIRRLTPHEYRTYQGRLDEVPGIFGLMGPMPGAIAAFRRIAVKYDTYILSTAPWGNPSAWSDKLTSVQRFFGDAARKRLILSHNKQLNVGDYLVDDRPNNGAAEFGGEWLWFGEDGDYLTWDDILVRLDA